MFVPLSPHPRANPIQSRKHTFYWTSDGGATAKRSHYQQTAVITETSWRVPVAWRNEKINFFIRAEMSLHFASMSSFQTIQTRAAAGALVELDSECRWLDSGSNIWNHSWRFPTIWANGTKRNEIDISPRRPTSGATTIQLVGRIGALARKRAQ